VTSPASGNGLPDYAPIPSSARGVALNDRGYYVGRVERNLYWVTDGVYQSAFLATRDDVAVHQQYIADIEASAREALASVDPVPFYMHYGENVWAGVKANLDTVTERAAAPVIAKYTSVLAAADIEVFTMTTTFQIMQSLRLDRGLGVSRPVNP
jgi:hypothetical protein